MQRKEIIPDYQQVFVTPSSKHHIHRVTQTTIPETEYFIPATTPASFGDRLFDFVDNSLYLQETIFRKMFFGANNHGGGVNYP